MPAVVRRTHCDPDTVAYVEVGRQNAPAKFWERCDTVLNAAGTLRAGYHASACPSPSTGTTRHDAISARPARRRRTTD